MRSALPLNTVTLRTADGRVRGEFAFKENVGRKYALINRRWCRIGRRDDGTFVEVWWERGFWRDSAGNEVDDAR